MARVVFAVIEIALLVFCLIDAVQTPDSAMRNLPKWAWIVLIIILPVVGPVAWLIAGRPHKTQNSAPWPSTRTAGFPEYERPRRAPRAPDDDPEFLATLKKSNSEHEDLLKQWEADLKRREDELRKDAPDEDAPKG
ncbi:MAG: PLD nuclease N-terminal domain-containing protein [Propionibacteriales bacterium]|nr:PLD nuclease N-terminal domain-containing protein [Propionibacteriales bacterium]